MPGCSRDLALGVTAPTSLPDVSEAAVGFRSERGPVLIALMVSTGLIAVDATILATAVPSIVKDLGGFASFPWLFSVYLLAQAVSVPVYAKLADTVGRKPLMLLGIALFLAGSVLCGFAWSMPALIAFRAVQPMAITIAGDIYSVAERARVQGYIASVWGISSVVGPALGGLFSQLDAWRWIFFVNVPLTVLAALLILRNFHEQIEKRRHQIDYAGAVLLIASMTLLILGVLEGGQAWAWSSPASIAVFAAGAVLLGAFVLVERRAAQPVLPLWVLSRRLLLTTSLLALGVGAILIGLSSYVPTYLEGAIGSPPLVAGLALAALTIGWPIAAAFSGKLFYLRYGFKPTVLIGMGFILAGIALLTARAYAPDVAVVAVGCFIMGLGLGLVASPSLIAAQASVEWDQRGVVTGANMFARSIGSAVGVAIFGAVANGIIARGGGPTVPTAVRDGAAAVFWAVLIASVVTTVIALFMPKVQADVEPAASS